jgi:hypothetical protein
MILPSKSLGARTSASLSTDNSLDQSPRFVQAQSASLIPSSSDSARSQFLQISSPAKMPQPTPLYLAEAIYLQAAFAASGAYPDQVKHNPRMVFRIFEGADMVWLGSG